MNLSLFATPDSSAFAARLAGALSTPLGDVERETFPDGEVYLRFPLDDRFGLVGRAVVLVGATDTAAALDDLYRLGCAAVKYGAESLTLAIPYFGYSTMERAVKPGEVVTAKVIARQLSSLPRAPRGSRVLLMDLHAAGIVHYFEGDTVAMELYGEPVLLDAIRSLGSDRLTLASADMGRAKWVERFANKLGAPVALIHKRRHSGTLTEVAAVLGDVAGRDVVLYDDMIRTGGSLIRAADAYLAAGARSVRAATTHLALSGGAVEALEASALAAVIGTDTHPRHSLVEDRAKFSVRSVAGVFAEVISRMG